MKTAIVYISNHGTSEKIAKLIQSKIGSDSSVLFNLRENENFDLKPFENIIIGGSIHAGTIQKKISSFCEKQMKNLLQKEIGLFLCGMYEGVEAEKQIAMAFPTELKKHAKTYQYVGGEFIFEKMNFFEKMIVKKIVGISESTSKINEDNINKLVAEFV